MRVDAHQGRVQWKKPMPIERGTEQRHLSRFNRDVYFQGQGRRSNRLLNMAIHGESSRVREFSPRQETAVPGLLSRPFVVVGAIVLLALASTMLLWAYLGTVVFFESIRNGFAMCFG